MATNSNSSAKAHGDMNLADLPDALIAHVAVYLATPSRAIFAAAMTAPSSSWQRATRTQHALSPASRAILDSQRGESEDEPRNELDFEDVETSLARKLTDDDVCAILTCTNAKEELETLKLAGCVNIVGCGLEPLRGSTRLELLDLSCVKQHEQDYRWRRLSLSQEIVLPILHSMIDADCFSSLRYIQWPKAWRGISATDNTCFRVSAALEEFIDTLT